MVHFIFGSQKKPNGMTVCLTTGEYKVFNHFNEHTKGRNDILTGNGTNKLIIRKLGMF
jgi:hypothetical protein